MIRKSLFVPLIVIFSISTNAQSINETITKVNSLGTPVTGNKAPLSKDLGTNNTRLLNHTNHFTPKTNLSLNANSTIQLAAITPQLTTLSPTLSPSSNFDLSTWDLVTPLPIGGIGNAIRIYSEQLVGNPLLNTGYTKSPYFYTDSITGSMNFFAPLNGATTPGTNYARCELSEDTSLEWNLAKYKENVLTTTMLIRKMPSIGGRITIGQIHFRGNTDPYGNEVNKLPLLKVMYDTRSTIYGKRCGGCLTVEIRKTPTTGSNEQTNTILITDVKLNTLFTYVVTFRSDGALTAEITNNIKTYKLSTQLSTSKNNTIGWGSQYFLFHAGCYLNVKGTSSTDGAQVNIYYLNAKHI